MAGAYVDVCARVNDAQKTIFSKNFRIQVNV